MKIFQYLSILSAFAIVTQGHDFKFCDKDDHLGINVVTLNPDPVKAGGKLNVEISGYIMYILF